MKNLIELYSRDLDTFIEELEKTPDELLWKKIEGVANSCGILAQHLAGNLNHFIGAILGDTGYKRERDKEFTPRTMEKRDIIIQLNKTKQMIVNVLSELDEKTLEKKYPLDIPWDYNVHEFLLHLYGHLNYHRGQFNYLRRILREK